VNPRDDGKKRRQSDEDGEERSEPQMENGKQRPNDSEDLKNSGDLARIPGLYRGLLVHHSQDPKAHGDEDISAYDYYRQPVWDDLQNSKGDEGGGQEEFVGDGVQIGAQIRPLTPDSGEETIEGIGYSRDDKRDESPVERFRDEEDDE